MPLHCNNRNGFQLHWKNSISSVSDSSIFLVTSHCGRPLPHSGAATPREPFFQFSWKGGIIKQSVCSQVFHLLVRSRNIPIQRLAGWWKGFFSAYTYKGKWNWLTQLFSPGYTKKLGNLETEGHLR